MGEPVRYLYPEGERCGREAALSFPGEDPRVCQLEAGHTGSHRFPPRDAVAQVVAELGDGIDGPAFGAALCDILGLDGNAVTELRIQCRPGGTPQVVVNLLIDADQAGKVLTVASRYRLVPR